MDRIIVDSNILFSAILNLNSRIGQILINGQDYFEFYSPKYVRTELLRYKEKIKKNHELFERRISRGLRTNLEKCNHPRSFYSSKKGLQKGLQILSGHRFGRHYFRVIFGIFESQTVDRR